MRDDDNQRGQNALDDRIEAALRHYADPPDATEPRIAVARILERVQAERPARPAGAPKQVRWWMWGIAGAATCLTAIMAALWVMRVPHLQEIARTPQAPSVVSVPAHPDQAAARVAVRGVRRTVHPGHSALHRELAVRSAPLPKLEVFPTPRPLSPEEQALVAFAKHGPAEVKHAVLEDQKHWDDPIIVADMQNRPPQSGSQQDR